MAKTIEGAKEDIKPIRLDPFMQPPILKALFEQLPVEELAKCRLVSKLWNEESLLTWRSNATLKFEEKGIVSTRDDGSTVATSLEEFLDLWEAGEWASCPFKKFHLHSWKFKAGDVEQKRFLELVGGHITSLTLEKCKFVGRDNFRRIIYQAFPNFQFLKMVECIVDDDYERLEEDLEYKEPAFGVHGLKSLDISSISPYSMMDILSHFHKVKSLHLAGQGGSDYPRLLEMIRLIREQDSTKLPLKNFDVECIFELGKRSASSIVLLKLHDQLNLPLQRLLIWYDPDDDMNSNFNDEDVIRNILQCHASTLKSLEFSGYGGDRPGLCNKFPFALICLKNLGKLVIPTCFFDHFHYLKCMPNLRVLEIWNDWSVWNESDNYFFNFPHSHPDIGDWTLPTLTKLKLDFPLSDCNLRTFMKWMPNVEHLSGIRLDDVKFSMICENWKNLKHLADAGSGLTDEGVIGIENAIEQVGDEIQSCPNITKLENLTTFETLSSKLTSASVHGGFLKLGNLKVLMVGKYTKLDDETTAILKRRKIQFSTRPWYIVPLIQRF